MFKSLRAAHQPANLREGFLNAYDVVTTVRFYYTILS